MRKFLIKHQNIIRSILSFIRGIIDGIFYYMDTLPQKEDEEKKDEYI